MTSPGAPIGFIASTGIFLLLGAVLSDEQLFAWGWRIPFLASAALVWVGLYVRLRIEETPDFKQLAAHERVRLPILTIITEHPITLLLGTAAALATFVLFYLMTVFTLSWGTSALGYSRQDFLELQLLAVLCFGATIPISAWPELQSRRDFRCLTGTVYRHLAGFELWTGGCGLLPERRRPAQRSRIRAAIAPKGQVTVTGHGLGYGALWGLTPGTQLGTP